MRNESNMDYGDEGRKVLFDGDAERALAIFKEGLAEHPGDLDLLLGTAMAHIDLGNYVRAIEVAESLVEARPTWGDALQALADACLKMGRKKRAFECILQATGIHECDAEFINTLALLLARHHLYREAAACHAKALERGPSFAPALLGLGVCRHKLGDPSGAIEAIQRAVEAAPDYFEAWCFLGHLFHDNRRKPEAKAAWGRIPIEAIQDSSMIKRLVLLCPGPENATTRKALRARLKQLEGVAPKPSKGAVAEQVERLEVKMDQDSLARAPHSGFGIWGGLLTILGPCGNIGLELNHLVGKMYAKPVDPEKSPPRLLRFDRVRAEKYLLLLADFLSDYPWSPPYNAGNAFRGAREETLGSELGSEPENSPATETDPEIRRRANLTLFKWADVLPLLVYGRSIVLETRRRVDKRIFPTVAVVALREALERLKPNVPSDSPYWKAWLELRATLEAQ